MSESIATLLAKAIPNPKSLRTKDGADALVLSLHCLMVDGGFVTRNPKDIPIKGFAPPSNWRQHPQEWIIAYTRPGAACSFVLRCSLQEATGRLFIHASETGPDNMPRRENIQVLGLQLANYTSGERCNNNKTWEAVIQNERTLMEMFREFVSGPLWEAAEKVYEEADDEDEDNAENKGENGIASNMKSAKTTTTATPRNEKPDSATNGIHLVIEPSSSVSKALASMSSVGITRRNVLLAAAVGSGAATAFYFYKNYKETGSYIPVGVENAAAKLIPASLSSRK